MQPFETLSKRGQVQRLARLARNALTDYDLGEYRLRPIQHGDNTTFRVTTEGGERHVLRIHRSTGKTPEAVRSEMMWLEAIRLETPLGVPDPLCTRGRDLLTVAGAEGVPEARICVLFRWLEGRFADGGLTPGHLERVGVFMARLQEHGARFRPPEGFVRGRLENLYGKPKGVSEALARAQTDNLEDETATLRLVHEVCGPEVAEVVERFVGRVRRVQLEVGRGPEVYGLIHGDLHQENYLFHRGQVRAIDFDDCGYGHYLYDLAVTLFNIESHPSYPELRRSLLAGYRSVRPLSTAHEQHLETFMGLRELQMTIWNLEMRHHPAFRESWAAEVDGGVRVLRRMLESERDLP